VHADYDSLRKCCISWCFATSMSFLDCLNSASCSLIHQEIHHKKIPFMLNLLLDLFLALSGSLFSTDCIFSVVLHALYSLDLASGIQLQSKFLTAVSSQHPAQESGSCLHSPCGESNSWCTQSGVMQPIYDPVHRKEHVSRSCHVHLPGC